jgi:hypothetical protein
MIMGALESPKEKKRRMARGWKTLDRYELGDFGLLCVTIFSNLYTYNNFDLHQQCHIITSHLDLHGNKRG